MLPILSRFTVLFISLVFCTVSWAWTPYVGAAAYDNAQSYNYGGGVGLFAGYESVFGESKNLYLAGELNLDAGHYTDTRTSIGTGISVLPGVNLTNDTTLYARLGLEEFHYKYSGINKKVVSTISGLGIRVKIYEPWNLRFEYINSESNIGSTYNLGVVYKFI